MSGGGDPMRPPRLQGVTLRRARPEDGDALAALMNDPAVYPGVMQLPYTDGAFHRERLAGQNGGPSNPELHLVAVHDGRIVGSAGLHPAGTAVRRRHAMHLGMTVAGPWQGQGVGSLLLGAICEHADRWLGIVRLELTVYADNRPAIALYRKHGFEHEGRMRGFALRDGQYVDALMMARLHPDPPRLAPAVGEP